MPWISLRRARWALALSCLAAYGSTLGFREFVRDDQWLIARNPLLRQGLSSIPALLSTGYWEASQGSWATVQEYRPLLMLSFLIHTATTGMAPGPMHAGNVLLHALCCLLVLDLLRRRLALDAALAGAGAFALLPVHAEAVSYLTSRSELLSAAFLISAWLTLEAGRGKPRPALGLACFAGALLTKEHSVLFPILLAMDDWARGARPRKRLYGALLATVSLYLLLRTALLGSAFHAGIPYFKETPYLGALLTMARFAVAHYLLPALTGTGLCADFSRPLIADAGAASWDAWLCLAGLAGLYAWAAAALARRRAPWAFWLLAPSLFLLPTSNLIIPIDTLGAERFLYLPSLGLAYLFARLWERRRALRGWAALFTALMAWYLSATARRNSAWASELSYYQAALACNPLSARAHSGLGAYWCERGDIERGRGHLSRALALGPRLPGAYYNLARAAWAEGKIDESENDLKIALSIDPKSPDALALMALIFEARGRGAEAERALARALELMPWHPEAHFNMGRLLLKGGRPDLARRHFARFSELAPDDPDAAAARELSR